MPADLAPGPFLVSTLGALGSGAPSVLDRYAGVPLSDQLLISIIDDDQPFRDSMQRLVRSLGYTVATFSSAADFLASARLRETSCLITDVHMPVVTGVQLYRYLLEAGHAIPTIFTTAYPSDVERVRALNDGVLCYLRKPIDEQQLSRCLRAALVAAGASKDDS